MRLILRFSAAGSCAACNGAFCAGSGLSCHERHSRTTVHTSEMWPPKG